ncbi:fructose bisphosphate aldolase [Robertkochia solimangrovi]|uniref:fructose bisphosphate aldolase n=1 Tax=Robertkochia solimangrovi TaxID=2213046 RepID=UPI0011805285|nr:fructose bisphosphate aldolase [Robertkochia solimangrovi]TRZ44460.1 fructose bisphosphate aldolase [Robertkochia solimangrovi]
MDRFQAQYQRIKEDSGFIAALDQSGGSTPGALASYGITENEFHSEAEMFEKIHEMRTRVMTDPRFTSDKILGVILFDKTMKSKVEGVPTPSYLWEKHIVPFLKVDKGLEEKRNGVKLMKPMPDLDERLEEAASLGIFGTKMRSVIYELNSRGIEDIVSQQFEVGRQILSHGLIPILEPEVDIHAPEKKDIEHLLKDAIKRYLDKLKGDEVIILKLTIPTTNNLYLELVHHPRVLRVFALSGGYSLDDANHFLIKNNGMIASFSRALLNGLHKSQTNEEFSAALGRAIDSIYKASVS